MRCPVVLEFVSPEDEMITKLTANKIESELHDGRTRSEFETILGRRFDPVETETLGTGTRVLYNLRPR
jgi:hypothetical protein